MKLRNRFTRAEVAKLRRMMAAFDSAEAKLTASRSEFARMQEETIRPPVVFLDKEPLDVDAQHGQEF